MSKFRERNKISSLFVYVLYKMRNSAFSRRSCAVTAEKYTRKHDAIKPINPFAPGDFAEKHVLKLVEWFSGHCHDIKS